MSDHRDFTRFMTEADGVKWETESDLPAYKIRALIELLGRDGAIAALTTAPVQ